LLRGGAAKNTRKGKAPYRDVVVMEEEGLAAREGSAPDRDVVVMEEDFKHLQCVTPAFAADGASSRCKQ
jgi:hypothetical protein